MVADRGCPTGRQRQRFVLTEACRRCLLRRSRSSANGSQRGYLTGLSSGVVQLLGTARIAGPGHWAEEADRLALHVPGGVQAAGLFACTTVADLGDAGSIKLAEAIAYDAISALGGCSSPAVAGIGLVPDVVVAVVTDGEKIQLFRVPSGGSNGVGELCQLYVEEEVTDTDWRDSFVAMHCRADIPVWPAGPRPEDIVAAASEAAGALLDASKTFFELPGRQVWAAALGTNGPAENDMSGGVSIEDALRGEQSDPTSVAGVHMASHPPPPPGQHAKVGKGKGKGKGKTKKAGGGKAHAVAVPPGAPHAPPLPRAACSLEEVTSWEAFGRVAPVRMLRMCSADCDSATAQTTSPMPPPPAPTSGGRGGGRAAELGPGPGPGRGPGPLRLETGASLPVLHTLSVETLYYVDRTADTGASLGALAGAMAAQARALGVKLAASAAVSATSGRSRPDVRGRGGGEGEVSDVEGEGSEDRGKGGGGGGGGSGTGTRSGGSRGLVTGKGRASLAMAGGGSGVTTAAVAPPERVAKALLFFPDASLVAHPVVVLRVHPVAAAASSAMTCRDGSSEGSSCSSSCGDGDGRTGSQGIGSSSHVHGSAGAGAVAKGGTRGLTPTSPAVANIPYSASSSTAHHESAPPPCKQPFSAWGPDAGPLAEAERREAHELWGLPLDTPLLREGAALRLNSGAKRHPVENGPLRTVHAGVPPSGMLGGRQHLVWGDYLYYHYGMGGLDDRGWGCAYRSLQTIVSWFLLNHFTPRGVPTHRQIQATLVAMGDKPASFIGSSDWIGSLEVGYWLDEELGVSWRNVMAASGPAVAEHARELCNHFDQEGTPVMMGGGNIALTLLGVDWNEETGDTRFLVLDPHYTGLDDLHTVCRKVVNLGGYRAVACGWRSADTFSPSTFHSLCLPLRPKCL